MKVKVLITLFLISGASVCAQPSVEDRGQLIACSVAIATARQELPFYLRWGIKHMEPVRGMAQELEAALVYQQQQVAQAHDEYEKKAQTNHLAQLTTYDS